MNLHRERRRELIERLQEAGVSDLAVLHAFERVPRHLFVPDPFVARAYRDVALPLGHGQTISRPSTHARYLQALGLRGHERLLEVGTGSGFQTALLATLGQQVFSVEKLPELARAARERIDGLGITNVLIRAGDGSYGWRRYAPFDAILVAAGAPEVPPSLLDQLADGGQLLIPIGDRESQELHRIIKRVDGSMGDEVIARVRFVALQGARGTEAGRERVLEW